MSLERQRHHRQRLQKKRRFHWGRDLIDEPGMLSRVVITPCSCSCWMCGNPRKRESGDDAYTMQERRAHELEREQ